MNNILVNDQFVPREQGQVDIEDRGYQFGDGVYEVVRVYGGEMFTANEHLARLFESAAKIFIELPFTQEELTAKLQKLVEMNKLQTGFVYLQVTRGAAPRQHQFPEQSVPMLTANTREMARPIEAMSNGVSAIVTADVRWLRCDIKSLNLLGNILAKQEATANGSFEAVLHRDGTVTEGSSSNMFIIKDNQLLTHPATNLILNGITRRVIFRLCNDIGLSYKEDAFTLDELYDADELFMASTTAEVMPIVQVSDKVIGSGKPGVWTKNLQVAFKEAIQQECGKLVGAEG